MLDKPSGLQGVSKIVVDWTFLCTHPKENYGLHPHVGCGASTMSSKAV